MIKYILKIILKKIYAKSLRSEDLKPSKKEGFWVFHLFERNLTSGGFNFLSKKSQTKHITKEYKI